MPLKALSFLGTHTGEGFSAKEISHHINESYSATRKALLRLSSDGVVRNIGKNGRSKLWGAGIVL